MKNILKYINFDKIKISLCIAYLWIITILSIVYITILLKIPSFSFILSIILILPIVYISDRLWKTTKKLE